VTSSASGLPLRSEVRCSMILTAMMLSCIRDDLLTDEAKREDNSKRGHRADY